MFPRRGWINFHASSVYTYKLYYLLESHVDRRLGGLLQTSRYLSGGVWSCVGRIALPMTRARGMRVGKSKGYNGVRSENAMPSQNHIGLYFYRANSYASAVLAATVILFVRPSVCHTCALWQNQTMHCGYFDTIRKGNRSGLLTPTVVGGRRPFRLKLALKMTQPFEKLRLREIYAYNISTVRDSKFNYDE